MSGFLSSRYMKYRELRSAGRIEADRHCDGCGYNVRGLRYGANCPECGRPIEATGGSDLMLSGPHEERAAWRLGLMIAATCLLVAAVARLAFVPLAVGRIGPLGAAGASKEIKATYLGLGLLLALLWAGAAWAMTPRRLLQRWPKVRWLRWFVRGSQLLWPLAYVCWMFAALGGENSLALPARGLRLLAGIGAIALAFLLSRVAEQAELEDAARRLNAAAWLLPVATLLPQAFPDRVAWFTLVILTFFLLAWAWVMLLFARGTLEMQRHVSWAMRHTADRAGREERVEAARASLDRDLEASVRTVEPAEAEIPLAPRDGKQPGGGASTG
jgi:hypothetical protein